DRVSVAFGNLDREPVGPRVIRNRADGLLAPGAVQLADLNSDGVKDLIVANSGGNAILVYLGLSDGGFGPPVGGTGGVFVGTDPSGLRAAALGGDGEPDLVVANTGSNDVSVLLGQGSGSSWPLTPGPRIRTDTGPAAVAVGTLLNDGHPDLAVANRQANDV